MVVDGGEVQVLMGNRSRAALSLSVGGLHPILVSVAKSFDTPREADLSNLLDTEAGQLVPVPPGIQRLLEVNANIPPDSACLHPMATVRVDLPADTPTHITSTSAA
jgi:hypothetical protein